MNLTKKMVLTPVQNESITDKKQSELDQEMSRILNSDLDEFEKIKFYNQILNRFLNLNKHVNEIGKPQLKESSTATEPQPMFKLEHDDTPVLGVAEKEFLNSLMKTWNINNSRDQSKFEKSELDETILQQKTNGQDVYLEPNLLKGTKKNLFMKIFRKFLPFNFPLL